LRALDTVELLGCFFHRLLEAPARPGLSFALCPVVGQDVRRPTSVQADCRRRRHQPSRPPLAKIRPGLGRLPAPTLVSPIPAARPARN